jgi:TetR/AcrR family transcriptional repressor of nem operon
MKTASAPPTVDVRATILAAGQQLMAGRGFSAVGLNEILAAAGVPKGSFYHYFGSKDAFGEAMLRSYFEDYLAELDATLSTPGMNMAARLVSYWRGWQATQSLLDCQGKCLAVKMAAEVADLSEAMRLAIKAGTDGIVTRLAAAIEAGVAEGSLRLAKDSNAAGTAASLYQLWLGASVMAKIGRQAAPFAVASATTAQLLHIPGF